MDRILLEDINYIANSKILDWNLIKGKKILITGGTGLLGSQVVLALDKYNQLYNGDICIYALVRNENKAKKLFADCTKNVHWIVGDILQDLEIENELDYIIHGASVTDSKNFVDFPVETIMTAIEGTNNILKIAKQKKVSGFVYLSSLEVYGVTNSDLISVDETQYGYIEQLATRSSYSEGKRLAECLCISYGHEYNIPVKIARLCQTFGPGVAYDDNRVFAQFARCVLEKKDIILKTEGKTYRNYCYTRDAILGIFCVLLYGNINEAYNIANKNTGISIFDMACMVAEKNAEGSIKVVLDLKDDPSKLGYGPTIKIALDTSKIEKFGWKATVDLEEAFERMVESMRCNRK